MAAVPNTDVVLPAESKLDVLIVTAFVVEGASLAVQYFRHESRQQYSPGLPSKHGSPTVGHSSTGFPGSTAVHPTNSEDGHCLFHCLFVWFW